MRIRYVTISKVGRRPNKEDAFRVLEMPEVDGWTGMVCRSVCSLGAIMIRPSWLLVNQFKRKSCFAS